MKKLIVISILVMIVVLSGCSAQQSAPATEAAATQAAAAQDAATQAAPAETAAAAAQAENGNITLEEAKSIALTDSGFAEADVVFKKAALDTDDGVEIYEIDFTNGGYEYEYDINPKTGAILEKSKEIDD